MADQSIPLFRVESQASLDISKIDQLGCEGCHAPHVGSYGSGRFCSAKCARGFSTAGKREEINAKVAATLRSRGSSRPQEKDAAIRVPRRRRPRRTLGRRTPGQRNPELFSPGTAIAEMSTVERGSLAEDFVYYQLRRRNIEVYRPLYPKKTTDFVIIIGDASIRAEVKATTGDGLGVGLRRTQYRDGKYVRTKYEVAEVDVFFLVDLVHEHVFVIPTAQLVGGSQMTLSKQGRAWVFKDRYDLLETIKTVSSIG